MFDTNMATLRWPRAVAVVVHIQQDLLGGRSHVQRVQHDLIRYPRQGRPLKALTDPLSEPSGISYALEEETVLLHPLHDCYH